MASDGPRALTRVLTWEDGLATFLGATLGPGLLVVALTAARVLGPAGPLGFLAVLPLAGATAIPFVVFLSSPLGDRPGGAYRHVSRTWNAPLAGFVVGWLAWGSYLAIAGALALVVGNAIVSVGPLETLSASAWAVVFLIAVVSIQIAGSDLFGWTQTTMVALLVSLLAIVLGAGALAVGPAKFQPLFPAQLYGSSFAGRLLAGLSTFLVAYVGLDVVAQTAGETRNARRVLPRVVLAGVPLVLAFHAAVAGVVLGIIPWWQLVEVSRQPLTDAARIFLPDRALWLVAVVAVLAAATTASVVLFAASRLLVSFGRDRLVPAFAASVRGKSRTPAASLLVCWACCVLLVVSGVAVVVAELAVAGLAVVYVAHSLSAAVLPFVAPSLYERCEIQFSPFLLGVSGILSASAIAVGGWYAVDPGSVMATLREFGTGSARDALAASPILALVAWSFFGAIIAVRYRAYLEWRGVNIGSPESFALANRYARRENSETENDQTDNDWADGDWTDNDKPDDYRTE